MQFKGTYTALATPFNADGSLDLDSLANLCDFQLKAGVNGFVACGSTGEAATLSEEEYRKIVTFVQERAKGKVPVVAGIGTNDTRRAWAQAVMLSELRVDGILVVTPPYNKPPQRGIVEHFRAVKGHTELPIIAYNIPGRSAANILPVTLDQMAKENLIVSVKESSGNMDQVLDIIALIGKKVSILSGEDSLVHAMMASGAHGVISASANVAPELFVQMTDAFAAGRFEESRDTQLKLLPIVRALFTETNPIPAKVGLHLRGVIKHPTVRLPLVPAEASTVQKMKEALGL